MATATALQAPGQQPAAHGSPTRPNMVAVGTIVWLSSELMFFAALFAMYFTVRSVAGHDWPPKPIHLEVPYSAVFTIILVLSSVTCQFGVFAAERGVVRRTAGALKMSAWGMREWFGMTFVMGLTFVLGQGNEYVNRNDFTPATNAYGSVYYITTGFHGLHVAGGLVAFLVVLARSYYGTFTAEKATSSIVVSYYWHFVDVVWIGLYSVIYLLQ